MLQAGDALDALAMAGAGRRLLGLLDLEPLAHGGHVTLRAAPSADARLLRQVHSMDEIPHREATYEFPAAIVLDRREGWFGIRLGEDHDAPVGWLPAEEAGTYWPLASLLVRRLTYLTDAWDGLLWTDAPGAGRVLRLAPADERPVTVEAVQDLAGSTWLEVSVLARSPCDGGEPATRFHGWLPAWAVDGRANVWFFARGC
jgi:hypothetical protein